MNPKEQFARTDPPKIAYFINAQKPENLTLSLLQESHPMLSEMISVNGDSWEKNDFDLFVVIQELDEAEDSEKVFQHIRRAESMNMQIAVFLSGEDYLIPQRKINFDRMDSVRNTRKRLKEKFPVCEYESDTDFTEKLRFVLKKEGKLQRRRLPKIRIRSLSLKNIGLFRELNLDFDSECTVLIGLNGIGKTTILRALALALIGNHKGVGSDVPASLLRFQGRKETGKNWASRGTMSVTFEIDGKVHTNKADIFPDHSTERIEIRANSFLSDEIYLKGPVIGFGQQRGFISSQRQILPYLKTDPPKAGDILPLINNRDGNHLHSFASWIGNLSSHIGSSGKKHPLIDKAFTMMSHITEERIEFDAMTNISPLEVWVRTKDSPDGIPLELASQGYQTIMGWVGYLLERMYEANDRVKDFCEMPAVVLTDEIDQFLHPKWQKNILKVLRKHFPNVQFIVTTHSPLVVDGLDRCQLTRLCYRGDEIAARTNEKFDIWAWEYQDILERIFDIHQNYEQYEEKVIPEIETLENMSDRTAEQDRNLQSRKAVLHRIESSRAAVDEIAAIRQRLERKEKELTELLSHFREKQVA